MHSQVESNSKFPVMMFIHGGGYQFGTGNAYGGKYFLDHDVVFVTINYRLGAFGKLFFALTYYVFWDEGRFHKA